MIAVEITGGSKRVNQRQAGRGPSTIATAAARFSETRVGHLFCLMHNGNMPHLRDLWPEWKHDERWWIHPMDERIRPEERRPGAEKPREGWPR